ncbi:hypothetical protein [Pseudalkalibacillus salsuginis]|uniref:hypothetical protein n=1 Tax=Pseudalkalibacillus salsuginis TaxID=2910972 RepID=UPI001F29627F|nr:hypothetical protein [Pseudalkalibacillus salsuginis]MCF6410382.1 hypothetical protein [Pseudalkalibacillus salsuginis]
MQQQPQQSPQNQQGILPQPPDVMTGKDQLYITDMMDWNLLAAKKCSFFAKQCKDQQVKAVIEQAAQMHTRHYDQLLQHLQSHLGDQMQNQNMTQ